MAVNYGDLINTATIGAGANITAGSVQVEAGSTAGQSNDFSVIALAGGGSTQDEEGQSTTGAAGAAGVNVIVSHTTATIADAAVVTATAGDVGVLARRDLGIQNIAGGGALTTSDAGKSIGLAIGVNYVENTTDASIGSLADVTASQNVTVIADAAILPTEIVLPLIDGTGVKVTTMVAGAALTTGSGNNDGNSGWSAAGSAAIDIFATTTHATIGAGADVTAGSDVEVRAIDDTEITTFAGAWPSAWRARASASAWM